MLLVNIDVPNIDEAEEFYCSAFDLRVGRRFGGGFVELVGAGVPIYLLDKDADTIASESSAERRRYERHWTPVHLDLTVEDLGVALARALAAGAVQEAEIEEAPYGRSVRLADPYGHGFCLLELSARGYDTIACYEPLDDATKDLIRMVHAAFENVKLGDGVGLREGQAIDEYRGASARAEYRSYDEKDDWSRIPFAELNACYSSLSFFDAEGMRFHLPAYLVAALQDHCNADLIFYLVRDDAHTRHKFSLLSEAQRGVVRAFLGRRRDRYPRAADDQTIGHALETIWRA